MSPRPTRWHCAAAAELAGDPMAATAPPADQWLLVEHNGPWGRHAITESGLDPAVSSALAAWTRANRARVSLIRRPDTAPRNRRAGQWFRVDARPGRESVRGGSYSIESQLIGVLDDPTAGDPSTEPIYLVCTHGRHDTCCALRGRPVAAALAGAFPQRTWECTHIGGDRFAANLVVLPHGIYYGHVPPHEAVDLAKRHDGGLLDPSRCRGRSSLPAPAQAAQHHARLATGETAIDAHAVLDLRQTSPDTWLVRLAGADGDGVPLAVTVRARMHTVDRALTCSGTVPDRFRTFELVQLDRER